MFRITCTIIAIVTGLYGAAYLLAPALLASLYLTEELNQGTLLLGRYFGSSLLFTAVACWLLKDVVDPVVRRALATAGVVGSIAGAIVSFVFTLNGLMTIFGWSAVAIYVTATVLWLLSRKQD
jgi:hypothetical protein